MDDKFVGKDNQEIPLDSIIHCLRSLFKLTNSGISHVVGKIDDSTYFADPKFFCKSNELAFSEPTDVRNAERRFACFSLQINDSAFQCENSKEHNH